MLCLGPMESCSGAMAAGVLESEKFANADLKFVKYVVGFAESVYEGLRKPVIPFRKCLLQIK